MDVRQDPGRSRFVAVSDGEEAGFVQYRRQDGDRIVFTHTEVDDRFEGQGVGSMLARTVLDQARNEGLTVVPSCAFIRGWIERHDDYADLVADG